MTRSSVGLDAQTRSHLATGYEDAGRALPPEPDDSAAAGAIRSTARDLALYARWQLDESDPVVALAHTPTRGDLGATSDPDFALGLNWQMRMLPSGARRIHQNGNIPGFSSLVIAIPELDVAVVVLANELDRETPGLVAGLADAVLVAMDRRAARE